eukprot:s990_g4.t1
MRLTRLEFANEEKPMEDQTPSVPGGVPAAQRPHELRELSSEVPREPSWPSDGPMWRNAEASTPTSMSSADKAAAAASQPTTQGTAAWDAPSPNSKVETPPEEPSTSTKKCTPKNPFWVQPEVPAHQKKAPQGSCDGINGLLSGATPLHCLSDVVDAGDRNFEIDIAEEDLTTVHISSWEQRLDWRSFLSEAVGSGSCCKSCSASFHEFRCGGGAAFLPQTAPFGKILGTAGRDRPKPRALCGTRWLRLDAGMKIEVDDTDNTIRFTMLDQADLFCWSMGQM